MRIKILLGMLLVVAGAVLSIFFWDLEYGWFQGGPLGILLILVGVYEVGEDLWRSRGQARMHAEDGPRGIGGGGKTPQGGD